MFNSVKSVRPLVTCRSARSFAQPYGPLAVTQRYPFAANSFTDTFGSYPIRGKSSAQAVLTKVKPTRTIPNSLIFMISPRTANCHRRIVRPDLLKWGCDRQSTGSSQTCFVDHIAVFLRSNSLGGHPLI